MHRYRLCEKWGGAPPLRVASHVDRLQSLYHDVVVAASVTTAATDTEAAATKVAVEVEVQRALASIPSPLRAEAESLPRKPVVQWTLPSGKHVRVMLAHPSTTDVSDVIPKTKAWFHLLDAHMARLPRNYHQRRCSGDLSLYLFLTDAVKKGDSSSFSAVNVNSGFTYACAPTNQICIFRYEEWWKVLMHESIHAYGLDFAWYENASMARPLQRVFPGVHCENWRICESWTECWAEILVLLHHIHWTTKKRAWKDVRFLVHCGLYYESIWSRIQCTKVLEHYGLSYTELLKGGMYQEAQDAPAVFSYYVLKCIAMNHLDDFLVLGGDSENLPWERNSGRATVGDAARDYVAFLVQHAPDPGPILSLGETDASLRMSLWGGV